MPQWKKRDFVDVFHTTGVNKNYCVNKRFQNIGMITSYVSRQNTAMSSVLSRSRKLPPNTNLHTML